MKTNIKFGLSLHTSGDFDDLLNYSLKAEKKGFDIITVGDHVFIPYEALTILTAIAARTKKIKIGPTVIDANRRSPATLAHATATIDKISNGRFILGIGRGVWNEASYGFTINKPIERMTEIIKIIKKFWTEDKINYASSFFNYKDAFIATKPVQKPHPPIWIAGFGPRMLKITGELSDGFISQNMSPGLFERDFANVIKSAKKIGRGPDEISAIYCAPMAISSDYNDALRYIEKSVRSALFRHGGPPSNWAEFYGYKTPWKTPEDVPLELVDKSCIFGTPDDCVAKIEKFMKKGVTCFIAQGLTQLGFEGIDLFADKVIKYFSE